MFHNKHGVFFFIPEHRGIVTPAIVEHTATVQVAQDEGAVLLCVAQGCPTPEYRSEVKTTNFFKDTPRVLYTKIYSFYNVSEEN